MQLRIPLTIPSEKIIKQDTDRKYDILVIGEESHVAYNRVGLSSFFEHRKIENLYLNPTIWVRVKHSGISLEYNISLTFISTIHSKNEPSTIT
jgi:nitrite reductase (NAD(P)H)